ncbi:MAG: alpha/beta hydrolase, partial [Phycicoccus sp.]
RCSRVVVPLDYDRPRGATVSLAVIKRPADDPKRRIGTVFANPGGPGGSGVAFLEAAAEDFYSPEVRARFDVMSFDPRGVAGSTPALCFDTAEQAEEVVRPFPFPYTRAEESTWIAADRAFSRACTREAGAVIDHMSTANVARDIDLLRRAVGDSRTTFVGYSYGSAIGSTYVNLFPNRVRAVIIDAVIDPISYATGRDGEAATIPVDARLESEQGAYESLQEFLRLCEAGGERCAFSAGGPKARYDALAARLRRDGPIEVPLEDGSTIEISYQDLVTETLGSMYDKSSWPALAEFLQGLDTADGTRVAAARDRLDRSAPGGGDSATAADATPYTQTLEGFAGVWCSDSDNPSDSRAWSRTARAADRRWPYFGRAWIWGSSICASWPGADGDRYAGPFDRPTSNGVLIMNTRFDPATRYQDAVSTESILPGSRLVTVEGWGHTTPGESRCADAYASTYLLTGQLPARGATCDSDEVPFLDDPARQSAAGSRLKDAILAEQVVPRR